MAVQKILVALPGKILQIDQLMTTRILERFLIIRQRHSQSICQLPLRRRSAMSMLKLIYRNLNAAKFPSKIPGQPVVLAQSIKHCPANTLRGVGFELGTETLLIAVDGVEQTQHAILDKILELHARRKAGVRPRSRGGAGGAQGAQRDGQPVDMKAWAAELLEQIAPLAALLDQSHGGDAHSKAVDEQLAKIRDVSLTPSAKVLASMAEHKESFAQFSLRQSMAHAEYFRSQPLSPEDQAAFEEKARKSINDQLDIEDTEEGDFDLFVASYQASILAISN